VSARHPELAQDVVLDSTIVGDDPEARRRRCHVAVPKLEAALAPAVGLGDGDLGDEVASDEARQRAGTREQLRRIARDRRDDPVLGAVVAEVAREGAGVDALETDDAVPLEVLVETQRRAEVRGDR